jgi:hypothetical protein
MCSATTASGDDCRFSSGSFMSSAMMNEDPKTDRPTVTDDITMSLRTARSAAWRPSAMQDTLPLEKLPYALQGCEVLADPMF